MSGLKFDRKNIERELAKQGVEEYIESASEALRSARLPRDVVEKLLTPYPDSWIEWSINSTYKDKKTGEEKAIVSPYVSGHRVVAFVNAVLGVDGWSYKIQDSGIVVVDNKESPTRLSYAYVVGCVEINGSVKCDIGESVASFDRVGGSDVNIIGKEKNAASVKNANTDAIKRSLRMYGIGLYLWFSPSVFTSKPKSKYDSVEVDKSYYNKLRTIGENIKNKILETYGG